MQHRVCNPPTHQELDCNFLFCFQVECKLYKSKCTSIDVLQLVIARVVLQWIVYQLFAL